MNPLWWLLIPAAYLLGSVSFAWIAGRLKGIDLRAHGSGNLGATNAGRVLGWHWFVVVFTLDIAKGFAPVYIACRSEDHWLPIFVAAAAVLGHVFTCLHGFKGGKAVATSLGVLIGIAPQTAGLIFVIWFSVWLIGWLAFRLGKSGAVGPASMIAALIVVPIYLWLGTSNAPTLGFLSLLSALVLWRHRSNFQKLFAAQKTESTT
ncbi:MAG: glycerol-3-phosphate 1-O-acyltransferase PlsY [Planctomycetota bacterium]